MRWLIGAMSDKTVIKRVQGAIGWFYMFEDVKVLLPKLFLEDVVFRFSGVSLRNDQC